VSKGRVGGVDQWSSQAMNGWSVGLIQWGSCKRQDGNHMDIRT